MLERVCIWKPKRGYRELCRREAGKRYEIGAELAEGGAAGSTEAGGGAGAVCPKVGFARVLPGVYCRETGYCQGLSYQKTRLG